MYRLISCLLFVFFSHFVFSQSFFNKADSLFSNYVLDGLVEYEKLIQTPDLLDELVKSIAKTDAYSMSKQKRKAFFINAYNITVIKSIIDNWPVENPLNIDGFFDRYKHNIGGEKMTLEELENELKRTIYNDPKIHFALVRGSISCPKINNFAYRENDLDKQLVLQTRHSLKNHEFVRVESVNKTVKVSEIFFWQSDDFNQDSNSVIQFINKYSDFKIPEHFVVGKLTYNWSINKL